MPDDKLTSSLEAMGKFFVQVGELSSQLEKNIIQPLAEFKKRISKIIGPLDELRNNMTKLVVPLVRYVKIASAVELLGKNQFVFWGYISEEFSSEMLHSEDIDGFMLDYYTKNESEYIKEIIKSCKNSKMLKPYNKLFSQSISAYNRKQYHLAIMGLLGVVDGLLSDISEEAGTSIKNRAEAIIDKLRDDVELSQEDFSVWVLYLTFMDFVESIGHSEPFDGEEPTNLNRHWIMHGRTRKKFSRLDGIKVILSIYGILLFDKLNCADYL